MKKQFMTLAKEVWVTLVSTPDTRSITSFFSVGARQYKMEITEVI